MPTDRPTPRASILDLKPYVGGRSAIAGAKTVAKLSSNENAWGPSPRAIEAYRGAAGDLHRYPDGGAGQLREAIARRFGIPVDRVVVGAGSDELISLLCSAYLDPGDEVIHTAHAFLMYSISARAAGGLPVAVPETAHRADVDAILAAVTPRTRLVFLANPNNPTGTMLPGAEIRRLHTALPGHVLLVLDAAYAEFATDADYESGLGLVASAENVVMTRTFSKMYGLAALRVGWAYCPPPVADVLHRVRGPFNVTGPSQAAATAALADADWAAQIVERTLAERQRWERALGEMGQSFTPSAGNFVLMHFDESGGRTAAAADAFLCAQGVILRRMEGYGLPHALRASVGTEDENGAALEALAAFQESAR